MNWTRRGFRAGLLIALLGALAPGGAVGGGREEGKSAMATFTDRDDGGRATVHVGDALELRLAENATTGYRWEADATPADILAPLDSGASYPNAAVGSGGVAIFHYRAAAPGQAELSLRYWRAWEGEGSIIRRFRLTVSVER
jgi:inhibitor of cysteine peptidase